MAKPVFQWNADLGAKKSVKPSVHQIKFGDGYEMRVPVGINFQPRSWQMSFTRGEVEAAQISDFLDARGAVESFTWTDPDGVVATYVCREWNKGRVGFGVISISGTFEQVFEY